jgi:mannose-1-phosphate guanylyltransferase
VANYLENNSKPETLNSKKIEIEAQNNFVRSEKTVAIIGLSDLVVIDSPNGILVCPKSMSGKVGEVPKILEMPKP